MIALTRKWHRYPENGKRLSLSDIAEELAKAGYLSSTAKPHSRMAISRMLKRKLETGRTS